MVLGITGVGERIFSFCLFVLEISWLIRDKLAMEMIFSFF